MANNSLIEDFVPLSVEQQRQRARFLKRAPIILTEEQQKGLHAFKAWMRMRHCTSSSSSDDKAS